MVIPFFVQAAMKNPAITVSKIASVAINILGIIHLLLHIFLRSNADRTAIRPVNTPWGKNRRLRLFGPTDLEMTMHITSPVLSDSEDNRRLMADLRELQEKAKMKDQALEEEKRLSCGSPDSEEHDFPEKFGAVSPPPQVLLSRAFTQNKSTYSIFPTHRSAMLRNSMSTTFSYGDEEGLPPPTPLFSGRHRRDLSEESSATVQIGLRISHLRRDLDQVDKTNSLHSFRFRSNPSPVAESQPVSPLSSHPLPSNRVPSDIVVLPIQANQLPNSDQTHGYGASLVVPGWLMRRESRSKAQQERERVRRMTMKALPPDPPTVTPLRTYNSI